jgi:hypothetical protein
MAFSGYLIKIGSNPDMFFEHFIIAQSYKVSKKIIDLNSFRDGNGELKRNALDHVSYTINFDIKPLNNTRMQEFLNAIRSNFSVAKERKVAVTFYNPESDSYITADFYMPDPEFNIEKIEAGQVYFRQTTIKFIGY